MFFDGFAEPQTIALAAGTIRLRIAGDGPAVMLLHGHPQTHAMWHRVAPALARRFRVICPDLPGYGGSSLAGDAPPTRDRLAAIAIALADRLGIGGVSVVGHDLGGHVGHRMAILAPDRVQRLALLGIVPTPNPLERADMAFSLAAYRSFWFAQEHPKPEALLQSAPQAWFSGALPGQTHAHLFDERAVEDYLARVPTPDAMTALNEARRRADGLETLAAPPGQERVTCPLLVLWGQASTLGGWYDPGELWQALSLRAVQKAALDCGHFMAEERPDAVADALLAFLDAPDAPPAGARADPR